MFLNLLMVFYTKTCEKGHHLLDDAQIFFYPIIGLFLLQNRLQILNPSAFGDLR
jgi:hypothetical protein